MPTPFETEAQFAAIGLLPILEAKPRLTKYRLEAAAAMPQTFRKRIARFLATDEFEPAHDAAPLDYQHVLGLVSAEQTPEQARALFATVPDRELATDLGKMAERITGALNGAIPREPPNPITLQPTSDPDPVATADFDRLWQVATDPTVVLDRLEDGSLIDEEVVTLQELFPALYAEMRQAVSDSMAKTIGARGRKWEPDPLKAQYLGTLMQRSDFDAELAAFVQAAFAAEAARQAAATPPPPKRARQAQGDAPAPTPGQRAAGG